MRNRTMNRSPGEAHFRATGGEPFRSGKLVIPCAESITIASIVGIRRIRQHIAAGHPVEELEVPSIMPPSSLPRPRPVLRTKEQVLAARKAERVLATTARLKEAVKAVPPPSLDEEKDEGRAKPPGCDGKEAILDLIAGMHHMRVVKLGQRCGGQCTKKKEAVEYLIKFAGEGGIERVETEFDRLDDEG